MKGKLKQNKGITLIALIITIIILLILAVVSIRLVMNEGVIGKAEKATTEYGTAEEQEQIKLAYADYQMQKAQGETNPTLKVAGSSSVTGDETSGWKITFTRNDGTTKTYDLTATGSTIDFETLKNDVLQNKSTYLAKAAAAGQNTTSNTDIGIGTDGSIINLNLWKYKVTNDNAIAIIGEGYKKGSYTGTDLNPVMPMYILVGEEVLETKYIGETASNAPFCGITNIESIIIPNTVTSICEHAFDSSSLKSITIPNGVTSIGDYAFQLCNFTQITIPDTITSIEAGTFCNCSNLKSVTLSNNLTNIGVAAFQGCSFTKITIPNSVRNIDDNAFIICNNLTEIKIDNAKDAILGSPWGATNATITYLR